MATRSLWRGRAKFAAVTTALFGGVAAANVATSDDPSRTLKLYTAVPVRLFRDCVTAASIAFDYEYSLLGLAEDSDERSRVKHEVHLRSARKLQELCFKNGGIYIKLGQHIGQLEYLVPHEYVQTMRECMLNKCPVSSYDQVCEVFKKELGETPDKIFSEFDPVPIASASLAQVHVAQLPDGRKVAVKVQHIHMTDTAAADQATVELIVNTLHWIFPSFDYRYSWMISSLTQYGKREPQLVLLDHGLYKDLDFQTRISYASLWKALIFSDAKSIKENSVKLGAGEDLYALFAGILTMRPWNRVIDPAIDHLVIRGGDGDRSELQMYASQYFPQISELLRRLPRVILLMLKTNDCLRSVNNALESSLETFLIIGRISSEAVIEAKLLESKSLLVRLNVWIDEILLDARLFGMQVALWLLQLKRALCWIY
uniref:ABC1 atypical kinase-like domain-containing protein n=1 Tax=Cannabis sativa TaxID=3483 RepID=A0A803P178_CANSA